MCVHLYNTHRKDKLENNEVHYLQAWGYGRRWGDMGGDDT